MELVRTKTEVDHLTFVACWLTQSGVQCVPQKHHRDRSIVILYRDTLIH